MNVDAGTMAPTEHGECFVLNDGGEVDLESVDELERALEAAISTGVGVTVDLADVDFIDSTGIHVLFDAALAADGNAPMTIADPPPRVVRIMELLGVDIPRTEIGAKARAELA